MKPTQDTSTLQAVIDELAQQGLSVLSPAPAKPPEPLDVEATQAWSGEQFVEAYIETLSWLTWFQSALACVRCELLEYEGRAALRRIRGEGPADENEIVSR